MRRTETGINVLDELLEGGFPTSSSVLFFSETLSEKRIFAEQFIATGILSGETCLYVDFYRSPRLAMRDFQKFGGFDRKRLVMIDAVSSQLFSHSEERYKIKEIGDLDCILSVIQEAIIETKPTRVVLDSLEFLTDRFPKDAVLSFCRALANMAKERDLTLLFLFTNWIFNEEDSYSIKRLADCLIEFKTSTIGGVRLTFLKVRRGKELRIPETSWLPLKFREMLGVAVNFPRILVTGSRQSGKTTFVRSLCPDHMIVQGVGKLRGFDHGRVEISSIEAEIFGAPGETAFAPLLRIFTREVDGIFLVIDSSKLNEIYLAKEILALIGRKVPTVIVANKQDLEGALSVEEVKKRMSNDCVFPIIGTVATMNDGVWEAMETLLKMIFGFDHTFLTRKNSAISPLGE